MPGKQKRKLRKTPFAAFCRLLQNAILLRMQSFAASGSWKWIVSLVRGRDFSTISSIDANICRSVFPKREREEKHVLQRLYFKL